MISRNLTLPENVTCLMSYSTLHFQTVPLYHLQLTHCVYHLIKHPLMGLLRGKSTSSFPVLTPLNLTVLMASPKILNLCAASLAPPLHILLLSTSLLLPSLLNGNPASLSQFTNQDTSQKLQAHSIPF